MQRAKGYALQYQFELIEKEISISILVDFICTLECALSLGIIFYSIWLL